MVLTTVEIEGEDEQETEEQKRLRYVFPSLDEVSDPEYWQSLKHHNCETEDEYEEIEVEEDERQGPQRDVGPGDLEAEGEGAVDIQEMVRRDYETMDEINASFPRMEEFANQQEADGDLAGAQRTRDMIESLMPL